MVTLSTGTADSNRYVPHPNGMYRTASKTSAAQLLSVDLPLMRPLLSDKKPVPVVEAIIGHGCRRAVWRGQTAHWTWDMGHGMPRHPYGPCGCRLQNEQGPLPNGHGPWPIQCRKFMRPGRLVFVWRSSSAIASRGKVGQSKGAREGDPDALLYLTPRNFRRCHHPALVVIW